ncbi:MAG: hisitidine kinase [Nocardioides sp.]|jgi:GAF domain-containing protein|uniref:GAF domain-containing protein n=1 Tax=Nocardioides sp. TaxID=35761 RepID=UPI00261D252E|nr:GAF domain-containing protein [Nocardioides sp.]MCW2834809.1 hisitidine kinase [Nocardioides sp.]
MEFLHRTQEALDEYVSLSEPDLEGSLLTMGDRAERIVSECVGLCFTLLDEDLTFALVAPGMPTKPAEPIDDPDVVRLPTRIVGAPARELLDEDQWAQMARADSAEGVASSLSLPVLDDGRVVGGITLYASSKDAFAGHHDELAAALGASAEGAVTNADLGFEARRRAEEAPRRVRDEQVVEVGTGILAARLGLELETARRRLHEAALQADVTDAQAATVVITAHRA